MLSLRTLVARSAPRALGGAMRPATAATARGGVASALRNQQQRRRQQVSMPRAALSATTGRASQSELSAKLESEMQIENEVKGDEPQSAVIKDFLESSPFELHDEPGQEVVKLTRIYNDEKITISFSIADLTNYDPYGAQDTALGDEDGELGDEESALQNPNEQAGVQAKGGARSAAAEESAEEEEVEEDEDEDARPAAIHLTIAVEKPGRAKGALSVEATATDGNLVVDNVFYDDAVQARGDAAYSGPPFGTLDEDLQVLLERFLEERGVTGALAAFVPEYVDAKEQAEYMRWLANVKAFVDA